ncbi:hypothetical protein [Pedobacter sp. NJ-S-72]
MYTLTIPVRPFVKKFIHSKYKCVIWKFSKTDRIGKYFYALLQKQPRIPEAYTEMQAAITIEIPIFHAHRKGVYLSQENINDFNEFIYEELVDGIVSYYQNIQSKQGMKKYDNIHMKIQSRGSVKFKKIPNPSIVQFFELKEIVYDHLLKFDINEDDLPFETIRKNVYRKLKKT